MAQEIIRNPFKYRKVPFPFRIPVANGRPIYAPRLPPGPGRAVPVALAGSPMAWFSGLRVKEKGVPGGKVVPDHMGQRRVDVLFRHRPVPSLPRLFRRPI
jgi:hypothetical protein